MIDLSNVLPFGGISTDSPEGRASSPVFQEKAVLGGGAAGCFRPEASSHSPGGGNSFLPLHMDSWGPSVRSRQGWNC